MATLCIQFVIYNIPTTLSCNVVGTLHCHVVILCYGNVAGMCFSQLCENNPSYKVVQHYIYVVCLLGYSFKEAKCESEPPIAGRVGIQILGD